MPPKLPEKEPNKKRKLTLHKPGTDWYPCRQTAQFKDNYDQIRWNKGDNHGSSNQRKS